MPRKLKGQKNKNLNQLAKNIDLKDLRETVDSDFETFVVKFAIFNMSGNLRNTLGLKSQCGDRTITGEHTPDNIKIKRINNDMFDEDYFREDWLYISNRVIKSSLRIMNDDDYKLLYDIPLKMAFYKTKQDFVRSITKKWGSYAITPYKDTVVNLIFLFKFFAVSKMLKQIMQDEKDGKVQLSLDKKEKMYIRTFLTKIEKMYKKYEEVICDKQYDPHMEVRILEGLVKDGYRVDKKTINRALQIRNGCDNALKNQMIEGAM